MRNTHKIHTDQTDLLFGWWFAFLWSIFCKWKVTKETLNNMHTMWMLIIKPDKNPPKNSNGHYNHWLEYCVAVSSLHKVHVKRCVKVTCVTNTDHIVKYSHSLGGLEQTYAMMYKVNWIFSLSISIFWGFACVFVPHISFFIRHLEFYIFISTDRWMHTLYAKLSFSTQIFCPSQF